ncbi:unnamed protein product [Vitrella brassicaformis CCMP3155]|uniref:CBM20 domain-containing protein n=2 Tax=Vitrella brassicaformis TaxID=1169539 RepID=A0A0G4EE58_VITBC|nr:unnamed protein product [Vitrella brassicaformis CCMP3155]|eukprot:CEL94262.1 unnamed protein product [Vitrella brassicaformis CCMP3155]
MYKFQVRAETSFGDSIGIVGSIPAELGSWDVTKCVKLTTGSGQYPLWWTPKLVPVTKHVAVGGKVQYKYVRFTEYGETVWEGDGCTENRWVPVEDQDIIIDDGGFGYIQPHPFGFVLKPPQTVPAPPTFPPPTRGGLKIVVIGSSVAYGYNSWKMRGWATLLGEHLSKQYGHQLINESESGANVGRTIERFHQVVPKHKPEVVIVGLSLGNEGLAHCPAHQRHAAKQRFESGIQHLIQLIKDINARPVLGGVYPNGDYTKDHYTLLKQTEAKMKGWGVPVLDFLTNLEAKGGTGKWLDGVSFDPAHPNSKGHRLMFESIDLSLFHTETVVVEGGTAGNRRLEKQLSHSMMQPDSPTHDGDPFPHAHLVFTDGKGFDVWARSKGGTHKIKFVNKTDHSYSVSNSWPALQNGFTQAMQSASPSPITPGIYIFNPAGDDTPRHDPGTQFCQVPTATAAAAAADALSNGKGNGKKAQSTKPFAFFSLGEGGVIETSFDVPPASVVDYIAAFHFFSPHVCQVLFYDGNIGILTEAEDDDGQSSAPPSLRIVNNTDAEYNVHPMWVDLSASLKGLRTGAYINSLDPTGDFNTLFIGKSGLLSRVKAAPKSAVLYRHAGRLSDYTRVGIVPLGARCTARMLLHKVEYDGPCYPFDLTRTSFTCDVSDMIASDFTDMWNPEMLYYDHDLGRVFHNKWHGLSYAHEVEEGDDPVENIWPVFERMKKRYSQRANRFHYTVQRADEVLFVRTGEATRGEIEDLLSKLREKRQGKPMKLMLMSQQAGSEFADLPEVIHLNNDMDPDRMYEDAQYWKHCSNQFKHILNGLGVTSNNLFWCPNSPNFELLEEDPITPATTARRPSDLDGYNDDERHFFDAQFKVIDDTEAEAPTKPPIKMFSDVNLYLKGPRDGADEVFDSVVAEVAG